MEDINPEDTPVDTLGASSPGILGGMDIGEEKSELDKIFEQMLNPENLHHFTELNGNEITGFSTLMSIHRVATKYDIDIDVLKEWVIDNLKFRVSKQRKGRAELVKITSKSGYSEPAAQQRNGWNMFRRD